MMIVMEHVVNGLILDEYLSDPIFLTWSQRLHICFGVACALNYWECKDRRGYKKKGFKILLDKDKEAKVLISFESFPDTKNSLGVILLEVLYGRKATIEDVNHYLTTIEKNHYGKGEQLDDMIAPNLRTQMHTESLSIFSRITYTCLKYGPEGQRDHILGGLNEAVKIQWKHENPLWMGKFAYLKIPLSHIKLATDDFADTYRVKLYRSVYKAELDHFNTESVSTVEGEKNVGTLKKTVIINRIFKYEKTLKDFLVEIEMLTNCKHPNLLSFLGFCDEEHEMILVFEYAFKETLHDYLRSTSNNINLSWEQRIRICLDIAHVLKYLHNMEGKPRMIHHGILSANVLLDEKLNPKVSNFRLSEFNSYPTSLGQSKAENFRTWWWDAMDAPWIPSDRRLVVDDIYFLGVILFEILTGRVVEYDSSYMKEKVNEFAYVARRHFSEGKGKLKNMADPRLIMEETQEFGGLKKGPDQDSFDTFSEVAYQCLEETPSGHPSLDIVIMSLEKALHFRVQKNMEIPLQVIKLATDNFDEKYCIGAGGYGAVYKAELNNFNNRSYLAMKLKSKVELSEMRCTVAIKRIFSTEDSQGKEGFLAELDVLSRCEHPNIVTLLGCCTEGSEMLLVYEHASNGSLDEYLESSDKMVNLTWAQRLKMCIDIAQGLSYLHTNMEDKRRIIHRDIKSANILLGENWQAKIADFGLSKLFPVNHQASTINTNNIAGTYVYLDPEYDRTGSLKRASDIYSFGVVLFEIFSGKLAYDSVYMKEKKRGLAPIAKRHFKMGTLIKEMLDPKTMDDEAYELGLTLKVRPDHDSLDAFSSIAYQCLAKTQADRPTIEVIIKELNKALYFQKNRMKALRISLEDIKVGVENFSDDKCIMRGGYGMLYKGKVKINNREKDVGVKRFNRIGQEGGFMKEFEVLFKYRHENIIGLVGYCKEMYEKIIVYDASMGSLNRYLNNTSFTWTKRLKTCIDIAKGLKFLHGGDVGQDVLIHREITSSNILLTEDWKAKICGFELSLNYPTNQEMEYVISDVVGSQGYCDSLYWETKILTKESDIYSFGVILFEILCGRLACPEDFRDHSQFLDVLAKHHCQVARLDEIVFEGIKEQIILKSFATFQRIALQCLDEEKKERPTAGDVMVQLQKALEFQEAYEMRKGKLQKTYKEILHEFSKSPETYSTMKKKDIYNILSKGILLEDDKPITHVTKRTTWNLEELDDQDYNSQPDDEDYYSAHSESYHLEQDDEDY